MPQVGSFLHGKSKSYAPAWESSEGFLPAFGALFAAKICDAAGENAKNEGRHADAAAHTLKSSVLKGLAAAFAKTSRVHAEGAAKVHLQSLLEAGFILPDPALSRNYQHIHFVGHSRGGALNARLVSQLHARGYRVNEYTCLDGFSTDWPDDAHLIADISISNEAAAAARRVSYRVERDLVQWVVDGLALDNEEAIEFVDAILFILKTLKPSTAVIVDAAREILPEPGTIKELKKFDIRAPVRTLFENPTLHEPGKGSVHTSITQAYMDGTEYFYDNWLGENFDKIEPPPVERGKLALAVAGSGETPKKLTSHHPDRGFHDGTFSRSLALMTEAKLASATSSGNTFVDAWLSVAADGASVLKTYWASEGQARILEMGTNALAELRLAPETLLSQKLLIEHTGATVTFDVQALTAASGSYLEVLCNSNVVKVLPLKPSSAFERTEVKLGNLPGACDFAIRLSGPTHEFTTVLVDNFVLVETIPPAVKLESIRLSADQVVITGGRGQPGTLISIESSLDLYHWNVGSTVRIPDDGQFRIELPVTVSAGSMFYRLRTD